MKSWTSQLSCIVYKIRNLLSAPPFYKVSNNIFRCTHYSVLLFKFKEIFPTNYTENIHWKIFENNQFLHFYEFSFAIFSNVERCRKAILSSMLGKYNFDWTAIRARWRRRVRWFYKILNVAVNATRNADIAGIFYGNINIL